MKLLQIFTGKQASKLANYLNDKIYNIDISINFYDLLKYFEKDCSEIEIIEHIDFVSNLAIENFEKFQTLILLTFNI